MLSIKCNKQAEIGFLCMKCHNLYTFFSSSKLLSQNKIFCFNELCLSRIKEQQLLWIRIAAALFYSPVSDLNIKD